MSRTSASSYTPFVRLGVSGCEHWVRSERAVLLIMLTGLAQVLAPGGGEAGAGFGFGVCIHSFLPSFFLFLFVVILFMFFPDFCARCLTAFTTIISYEKHVYMMLRVAYLTLI